MTLTEPQQAIIDKAIELLMTYDKENVSYWTYRFEDEEGEHNFCDYDCCDNEECYEKTLQELRKENPGAKIEYYCADSQSGNVSIKRCYQCERPISHSLSYIVQELEHHKQHSIIKENLTTSRTAFDVKVMFEAMPSYDYSISEWERVNNYDQAVRRQEEFVKEVVEYAEEVIKVLA